jgi:ATP-dependent Clp protease, protease subunit
MNILANLHLPAIKGFKETPSPAEDTPAVEPVTPAADPEETTPANPAPAAEPEKTDTFTKKADPKAAEPKSKTNGADTVQLRKDLNKVPFDIAINGQITSSTIDEILGKLRQFEQWYKTPDGKFDKKRVAHKPITFTINTPGGDVTSSLALIDKITALKGNGITIVTSIQGQGSSMGAYLTTLGSKGHRYMTPNSTYMLHQPMVGSSNGNLIYLSEQLKNGDHTKRLAKILFNQLIENLPKNTDKTKLSDAIKENHYLSAEEAKSGGFIDHIGFPPTKGFDEIKSD